MVIINHTKAAASKQTLCHLQETYKHGPILSLSLSPWPSKPIHYVFFFLFFGGGGGFCVEFCILCLCFIVLTFRSHFFATGTVWLQDVKLAEWAGGIHVEPFVDAVAVKVVVTGKFS